ncbi:MAG: electron transfer flavoprotein subunit beta [Solirubrobacterales bacterium]|nr:electron transfer flavoprotein subunit beta [Solirubrobacterales bacterium]
MRILVPVKPAARIREGFVLDAAAVSVPAEALEQELGESDELALESALGLAERGGDEVLVVAVAGEPHEDALRACLAKGADRAIGVWDAALAAAEPLTVARVLAAVAQAEEPELILCGAQSSDAANAATGVALAGLLDVARVAVVGAIERDGARLTVQRELEGGAVEVLTLATPALLTVQSGVAKSRHATLRAIKQARAKPLSVLALGDLGLDAGALLASAGSRTVRLRERDRGEGASLLEGEASEIAARIATIVTEALSA